MAAQMVKNLPTVQEAWVWSLGQEDSPGGENATHQYIFKCSSSKNFMDRGAWWATVHEVEKSWTRLND